MVKTHGIVVHIRIAEGLLMFILPNKFRLLGQETNAHLCGSTLEHAVKSASGVGGWALPFIATELGELYNPTGNKNN